MPDPDKRKIFSTLADKLPENLLSELFPEYAPPDIRTILRAAGGSAGPQTEGKPETSQPDRQPSQNKLPFARAETDTCSLYTDGASRGNPGDAGAGIVLLDSVGNELLTRSIYLGKCTNNAAEYQALIAGLESALEAGCKSLHIFLDSQLIVRQVQGIYKVKNEHLKPMYTQATDLLARLRTWKIMHVPREKNIRADELANKGIDDDYAAGRRA